MRPEKFNRIMNKAFNMWLKKNSNLLFKKHFKEMARFHNKYAKEEDDFRSGFDTYKYESTESIKNNMEYISDRWRCAFRLKWIIDGVKNGYI